MLELNKITKDYSVAGETVHALRGVSIKFRKNEFVSILGASGCGKTTLLNIIGGLDHYTSGDLLIEGVSTKEYNDRDWDTYRNHSIGFIFQSYHLIPHQTILQNVELALTISGVSKEERRRRAIEALEKVGLADKMKNRPNQLSGGQAQRVAIARALINDPEIVLADEPTGALDSKTSVQIMDLLKEISRDRLVIMVTHNPELAEAYSTRIIRLLDGEVIDDTAPYSGGDEPQQVAIESTQSDTAETIETAGGKKKNKGKKKKTSMSIWMAFMLSLKNLLSKRGRTLMVSVAGSIGIIGVSMVLAISAGVQNYIASMENDMLSGNPLTITETAVDFTALMDFASVARQEDTSHRGSNKVYINSLLETLMGFQSATTTNNITAEYKDYVLSMPAEYYNAIQLSYDFDISNYIYTEFSIDGTPETTEEVSVTGIRAKYAGVLGQQPSYADYAPMIRTVQSFKEMPDNYEYILSQYDVFATSLGGTNLSADEYKQIMESADSLILVLDEDKFSDLNFAQYGYMTEEEFLNFAYLADGSDYDEDIINKYDGLEYDYFIGENAHSFKWYPNDTVFTATTMADLIEMNGESFPMPMIGIPFKYNATTAEFSDNAAEGMDLKVKMILQKKQGISYGCLSAGLYHTKALTDLTIESGLESNIATYINSDNNPNVDEDGNKYLPMLPFFYSYSYIEQDGTITEYPQEMSYIYDSGSIMDMLSSALDPNGAAKLLRVKLGLVAGSDLPTSFSIYPTDFASKDLVTNYLDEWNNACNSDGTLTYINTEGNEVTLTGLAEGDIVKYTDMVGLIIAMINTMIQMITIALVAFTALSLVVSTVMVGIITYVSVVERIKEIGILRAVGARKKDIKRLFNAETFIIGLAAGAVGIAVTYLISLILNLIIGTLFGIYTIAALPWWQAIIMICVSIALTLISGLIPASAAAKKDPVVALRTE